MPLVHILRELRSAPKITLLIVRGTRGKKFQFVVWEPSDRAFETSLSFHCTSSLSLVRPAALDVFKEGRKEGKSRACVRFL